MTTNTALGDDLALLTLRAAQEVDLRLKGKRSKPNVFQDLGRELSRAAGIGEPQATAFLHFDPVTTEVFAQAVGETSNEPVSDIDTLTAAMKKIIDPLNARGQELSENDLVKIKMFCLALHKSMMAQSLPPRYERESSFEDEFRFIR